MFFFRAFAIVLFLFGFSANVPEFVNGLVIANPRSPLSTEAMTQSDIITGRQLNDNDQGRDIVDRAAVIQRGVPPSITSGGRGGRKPQPKQGEDDDVDSDDPREIGEDGNDQNDPDSVETHRLHRPDPANPDQCEMENISAERKRRCNERNLSPPSA